MIHVSLVKMTIQLTIELENSQHTKITMNLHSKNMTILVQNRTKILTAYQFRKQNHNLKDKLDERVR